MKSEVVKELDLYKGQIVEGMNEKFIKVLFKDIVRNLRSQMFQLSTLSRRNRRDLEYSLNALKGGQVAYIVEYEKKDGTSKFLAKTQEELKSMLDEFKLKEAKQSFTNTMDFVDGINNFKEDSELIAFDKVESLSTLRTKLEKAPPRVKESFNEIIKYFANSDYELPVNPFEDEFNKNV